MCREEQWMHLWRSNHHKEAIWMVDMFGKRGRHQDSSCVRVDVQYGCDEDVDGSETQDGECVW